MITKFAITIAVAASSGLSAHMASILESRWVDEAELCKISGADPGCTLPVTSTGLGVRWIGEVTAMQFLFPDGEPTGYVKVRVTWDSPDTDFKCGREYKFHMDELKDVTARSLSVRRCR